MRKNLFYIIGCFLVVLAFGISYFVGIKVASKDFIVNRITEEDLLETIRLNLDFGWHHYYGWENRKYNGMEILCHNDNKILFSIDLEPVSPITVPDDGNNYFTDYRVIYMGIEKKNGYYFRKLFYGDDMKKIDEEGFCE